jgi:hypothetical protein
MRPPSFTIKINPLAVQATKLRSSSIKSQLRSSRPKPLLLLSESLSTVHILATYEN